MIDRERYEHSGGVGAGAPFVLAGGILASIVLAFVYAYIDVYSPVVGYVSLVFVGGYAIGLCWVVAVLGRYAKCRSPGFMQLAGLVSGVAGIYACWCAFEWVLFSRYEPGFDASPMDVFAAPGNVWEGAKIISEDGWYSIGSTPVKGIVLWIFWIIEAVVIVGVPTLFAKAGVAGRAWCEDCGAWCESQQLATRLAVPEDETKLDAALRGDLAMLVSL